MHRRSNAIVIPDPGTKDHDPSMALPGGAAVALSRGLQGIENADVAGRWESTDGGRFRYPARRALPLQKEVHALESSSSIAPACPPESLSKLTFRVRSATPLESIEMPALEAIEPGGAWRWGISIPSYEGALRPPAGSCPVVVLCLGNRHWPVLDSGWPNRSASRSPGDPSSPVRKRSSSGWPNRSASRSYLAIFPRICFAITRSCMLEVPS